MIIAKAASSPTVASGLLSALDMLERDELLEVATEARIPILVPCQAEGDAAIRDEVQELVERGFSTLKVKVGFEVEADLERVRVIQRAADGRATLRLDANRGYDRTEGCSFASRLDPEGIELLEQPCEADAWEDNAAVAAVSTVPLMLDESIHVLEDIDRAAGIEGVGYVKVKLKKMGGVRMLEESLDRIRRLGMRPVLGDGVSNEISAWMEACVARSTIDNAGEMNGFLKTSVQLFDEPLPLAKGAILLAPGYRPRIDREAVLRYSQRSERVAS